MTTRPDERLAYRDLAKQGARVTRSLQADELPRLQQVAPVRRALDVVLEFSLDSHSRPWVRGHATGVVGAECQRCVESGDVALRADFELCILTDDEAASALAAESDVLTASGPTISVAEVVEDELLLGLPEQLCEAEPCPNMPSLQYPASAVAADDAADNPFRVLERMRDELKS